MVRDIVKDDGILSVECRPATPEDEAIAADLVDTLLSSDEAACLAANQIGESVAIGAYLNSSDKPVVLYNPKVVMPLKPYDAVEECLSHDMPSPVRRYQLIHVQYDELCDGKFVPRKKKLEGWSAQLVQHLVDHCNGELV
ncbi:MAG: peptide deformylase [Eggerthellaceae bacterium]|nr:peptide deformylase [Eggerthellaceae bacterium]